MLDIEATGCPVTLLQRYAGLDGQALFQALVAQACDRSLATQWIASQTAALANGGNGLPKGYSDTVMQSLVLADDGRAQISLAIVSAADWQQYQHAGQHRQIVGFADGWTRICFLAADDLEVQDFSLVGAGASRHAVAGPRRAVGCGETIDLANGHQAVRFVHMTGNVIMLRLLVRDPDADEAVECCALTGAMLRVRQAQSHEGRTQMIVTLLRSLGHPAAAGIVAEKLPDWPSYMRWHGVREALAMDSLAGIAMLDAMARSDPDERLQALAMRTRSDLIARFPQLAAAG